MGLDQSRVPGRERGFNSSVSSPRKPQDQRADQRSESRELRFRRRLGPLLLLGTMAGWVKPWSGRQAVIPGVLTSCTRNDLD